MDLELVKVLFCVLMKTTTPIKASIKRKNIYFKIFIVIFLIKIKIMHYKPTGLLSKLNIFNEL